jgi:hypothetical protein
MTGGVQLKMGIIGAVRQLTISRFNLQWASTLEEAGTWLHCLCRRVNSVCHCGAGRETRMNGSG